MRRWRAIHHIDKMTDDQPFEQYIEVVVPLPLRAAFTYCVPPTLRFKIKQGMRVIVPFGRKKFYTGIVTAINASKPSGFEVKEVLTLLDDEPIIRYPQLKYWQWIADYYMASLGDVYKAAVPAGLKLESETFVELNPDFSAEDLTEELSDREITVLEHLRVKGKQTVADVAKGTGLKNVGVLANKLLEMGIVIISEKLIERYRPKKEHMVRLAFDPNDHDAQRKAFESVKGARKQETLLLAMLDLTRQKWSKGQEAVVERSTLLDRAGVTNTILLAAAKKGIVEPFNIEVNRFAYNGKPTVDLPKLSEAQGKALREIHDSFVDNQVTLLHGVTSSGKTELYIHLIDYVMRQGNQALMLVPEIALTTQLTRRLQKVFGDKVIIYHSRFSDNERVDIWKRVLNTREPLVVLGARSAVFLPFANLALVIVDEEHETSYKQYDPAPRYNGRDAAIVLARMHGAKTLLGSATPSIETYYKAQTGKYGLVELLERYDNATLPDIKVVDMLKARKTGHASGTFADDTISAVRRAVTQNQQAILFLNRRGYSPMVRCKDCAWVPKCEHCDVSLTVHRLQNSLVCHYCGAVYPIPNVCPQCHEHSVEKIGYGTERVEEEVEQQFSGAKMLRMDLDSTRNKDSYEKIIDDFSHHKADILVGTQMVTKGLDFGDVSLVGVLNADVLINFPDFRSTERSFNMLSQVAGRAGRRAESKGSVIVQTSQPEHPVIKFVNANDYQGYYKFELSERERFLYPPFTRMIYIYLRHRDARELDRIANTYTTHLKGLLGNRVFGPEEPVVGRVQSLYIRKIMLKIETSASPSRVKAVLYGAQDFLATIPGAKSVIVHYDVDPM